MTSSLPKPVPSLQAARLLTHLYNLYSLRLWQDRATTLRLLVPSFFHGSSFTTTFCSQCSSVSALTFNMVKRNNPIACGCFVISVPIPMLNKTFSCFSFPKVSRFRCRCFTSGRDSHLRETETSRPPHGWPPIHGTRSLPGTKPPEHGLCSSSRPPSFPGPKPPGSSSSTKPGLQRAKYPHSYSSE